MDTVSFSEAGDAIGIAAAHVPAKKTKTPKTTPKVSPAHRGRTKSMSEEQPPPLTLDAAVPGVPAEVPAALLPEPLLDATEDRYTIFPIRHQDVWDRYKQHMSVIWMAEEIDLSKDMSHWEKLSDGERHFIKNIIGFFAGSDGIVMENLANRFMREVKWPEAADPFTYFIQAGAFHAPEEAEKQRARLQALGVQAQVTPREQSGGTVYRVRVGPFEKKDEADKMKTKLDSQTVESALVKVQR